MSKKVSIIITTCDREINILKEAIDSVVNQSYKNIEVIVVNDSSNRNSELDIIRLLNQYDKKITYFYNEGNHGANYARMLGFKHSDGQYIAFLDDDDFWDLKRLEIMIPYFNDKVRLLYSDIVIFNKKTRWTSIKKDIDDDMQFNTILKENFLGGFSNVIIERSAFEEVEALDVCMPSYQDLDIWIRILYKYNAKHVNLELCYYRISDDSISLNSKKKISGLMKILEKYESFYDEKNIIDKLRGEYINSVKYSWKENQKIIGKSIRKYKNNSFYLFKLKLIGILKKYLSKIVKR